MHHLHLTALYELAGVLGGLAILAGFGRWAWRTLIHPWLTRVTNFLDDWGGVPGRPGVPGRLGMMPRMKSVEDGLAEIRLETTPNGGHSMKDAVHRIESVVKEARTEMSGLREDVTGLRGDVDTLKADRVRFHGAD